MIEENIQTKYCLYSRKSTEQDERQSLSIESQVKEMLKIAEKENLNIVDIKRENLHSAKDSERDLFMKNVSEIMTESITLF